MKGWHISRINTVSTFIFQDLNIVADNFLSQGRPHVGWIHAFGSSRNPRQLVWLTYWLDMRSFGLNAEAWRRSSMLLHAFAVMLLGLASVPAAILFAIHPLTLMGSSYIAGRSGLISGLFQIVIGLLVLNGIFAPALLLAWIASLWVKEDSVIFFPMIGVLWLVRLVR